MHGSNPALVTKHSNVEPGSVEVNVNVGVLSLVNPVGPPVIVVSGTTESTVNVRLAGVGSMLPAVSMARSSKVCSPSVRTTSSTGETHAANGLSSNRHSNEATPTAASKEKIGVLSVVRPDGPLVIVVSGAVVSTWMLTPAGSVSTLPTASIARTLKTCGPSVRAVVVYGDVQASKAWSSYRHSKVAAASSGEVNP